MLKSIRNLILHVLNGFQVELLGKSFRQPSIYEWPLGCRVNALRPKLPLPGIASLASYGPWDEASQPRTR